MVNEEFYVGQIFEGSYPPAAAIACNKNGWYIEKIGDGVYEIKAIPEPPAPTPEEEKQARIAELKAQLDGTDYKIIKCSECQLAGVEMPYDVVALHAERQAIRDEINQLEGE